MALPQPALPRAQLLEPREGSFVPSVARLSRSLTWRRPDIASSAGPTGKRRNRKLEVRAVSTSPYSAAPVPALTSAPPAVSGSTREVSGASSVAESSGRGPRPVLVVLGCGWGGMSLVRGVDTSRYDVVMVSPRSYFLFTPLLPGVTTGAVEPRSLAEPIRRIMAERDFRFLEAEAADIDPHNKIVTCKPTAETTRLEAEGSTNGKAPVGDSLQKSAEGTFQLSYDYLVLAMGAQPNTFGVPGVAQHCLFLKELDDATRIRQRILESFEAASLPGVGEEEAQRLLHFVVVGGGPTGVEFSAELFDLVNEDLSRIYPALATAARITIIEAVDHILNMFDSRISKFAEKKFLRQGVSLLTGKRVVEVKRWEIVVQDRKTGEVEHIAYGTAIWSTGIGTRPVLARFMSQVGQHDRRAVGTDEWLRVLGCRDVWAIGDCSTVIQRPLADDVMPLFQLADKDKDGQLSPDEFQAVVRSFKGRYPQVSLYLRRKSLRQLLKDVYSLDSDEEPCMGPTGEDVPCEAKDGISIKEFEAALRRVDTQLKAFPATGQVAAQQGEYLSSCFNKILDPGFKAEGPPRTRAEGNHRFMPFRYMHLGQFAPLGSGQAGVQLPGDIISVGSSTQWLWYSVYAVKQVSWRTRVLVVFDWLKGAIFGRDLSKV